MGSRISANVGFFLFVFQVFYTHCVTNPDDEELMLSSPLPVTDYQLVTCWLPAEPARIAIMHDDGMNFRIVSFDIVIEKKSKYKKQITGTYLQIVISAKVKALHLSFI